MTETLDSATTALLCIDFYNDFLSEKGKLWPFVKEVAGQVGLLANLGSIVAAARGSGIKICHVPHRRTQPGDYTDWVYPTPYQLVGAKAEIFAKDSWGGEFHEDFPVMPGDLVAKEHWASSGFPNTDLEHLLRRHGIDKIICIGMLANTCLEATGRIGMELGFHVTVVRDATAAMSRAAMAAAMEINAPTYAHRIVTSEELVREMRQAPDR